MQLEEEEECQGDPHQLHCVDFICLLLCPLAPDQRKQMGFCLSLGF